MSTTSTGRAPAGIQHRRGRLDVPALLGLNNGLRVALELDDWP
jgi:hypothetical protein